MQIISNVLKNKLVKQYSTIDYLLIGLYSNIDKSTKNSIRSKMNVSLVMDVSGSMDNRIETKEMKEYRAKLQERALKVQEFYSNHKKDVNININIHGNPYQDPWVYPGGMQRIDRIFQPQPLPELPWDLRSPIEQPRSVTKLMLAVDAAKKALESLHDGDIISLVKFSSEAQVVMPSTVVTSGVKEKLVKILDQLKTEGATNLYDGWYVGAKQVAENIKENQVNRVVLLTDGEATHGYRTSEDFCPKVADILDAGISTSTIGFGDSFNEEMLESISISGNGNFYYAKVDEDLGSIFDVEFNDMKNTLAQKIEVRFDLVDGVTLKSESVVNREIARNTFSLPNLKIGSPRNSIFTLDLNKSITSEIVKDKLLGNVEVSYIDNEGKSQKIKETLVFNIISENEYEKAEDNKEVKVQKALIEVAVEQKKAMDELAKGNRDVARGMLVNAMSISASYGLADDRLASSNTMIQASVQSLNANESLESVKKSVHYTKYRTERGDSN